MLLFDEPWMDFLTQDQEGEMKEKLEKELSLHLLDNNFRKEVVEAHHEWCASHNREEESLLIPISRLESIKSRAPKIGEISISSDSCAFYVVKRHKKGQFVWDFYSDKIEEIDASSLEDAMEETNYPLPGRMEDILHKYQALAEEQEPKMMAEWEADKRLFCQGTMYAY